MPPSSMRCYRYKYGNFVVHLQAVVLSELVLLFLGQVADEAIEVRDHVLVCLESLNILLATKLAVSANT